MASRSNIFCCLRQFSSVVELFFGFLTSGLNFVKKLLGANFMVIGRSSFSLVLFVK